MGGGGGVHVIFKKSLKMILRLTFHFLIYMLYFSNDKYARKMFEGHIFKLSRVHLFGKVADFSHTNFSC